MKKINYQKCVEECDVIQTHVHEFQGSVMLASPPDAEELIHNHRFAGISGPVIPIKGSHVHIISTDTDFFTNHIHRIDIVTGPAMLIRDDEGDIIGHIHAIEGETSCNFFHEHDLKGTTLIENPIE